MWKTPLFVGSLQILWYGGTDPKVVGRVIRQATVTVDGINLIN